jgi:uncharacterized circularly permuted ATP-grasp superfamily protein
MKFYLLILVSLLLSFALNGEETKLGRLFDEIYGTNKNETVVRSSYEEILPIYKALDPKRLKAFTKISTAEFDGDNALHPMPRMLTQGEQDFLAAGVAQRGKAIQSFLKDYFSGKKTYADAGIIPESVVQKFVSLSQEQDWFSEVRARNLEFWYGPDIIRGPPAPGFPDGVFYVIEDNTGYVGGMGDLNAARDILLKHFPEYKEGISTSPKTLPQNFYKALAEKYIKDAAKYDGEPLVLLYPNTLNDDNEDLRIKKIFNDLGVEATSYTQSSTKRFEKREDGLYLVRIDGKKRVEKKIGLIVADMDPSDLDNAHSANLKFNPDEDTKQGIRNIFELIKENKLNIVNPPGMEWVNNKEFYMYVENLIKYYLKEEPILKNLPTASFRIFKRGEEVLDVKAIKEMIKNQDDYVIKAVNGRGGTQVWLGRTTKDKEWKSVLKIIEENPSEYIYQRYTPLSTLGDFIGDIRLHAHIGNGKAIVAPVPWSRINTINGSGKVNISGNGFEATVLISKEKKKRCLEILDLFI